jgi:P4 family phage/plasmid primase-like protien
MSVAQKITATDVRRYFQAVQPEWKLDHKQIHVPCPLHGGVRDSFSLNTETGQWFCNSDCGCGGDIVTFEQRLHGGTVGEAIRRVEEIVGQSFPATTQPRQTRQKMNIAATYDYVDEEGKFLYQVVRMDPKDFRQRQRREDGSWQWNLQGARRVPYRLPELRQASGPVFFVEGEKDADKLVSLGLRATTSPEGAGKWRDEYGQYFQGKNVYVIPDMDEAKSKGVTYPGQQHAAQVIRTLLRHATNVRLIELPGAKDVSEWLEQNDSDKFGELAKASVPMNEKSLSAWEARWVTQSTPDQEPEPVPAPQLPGKPTTDGGKKDDGRHYNVIAEELLQKHDFLAWGKESVWEYTGTHYKPISPEMIQAYALEMESAWTTRASRRREIANYVLLKARKERIPWRSISEYEVPLANGVLDLRTSVLRPHRKEDYLEAVMPIPYTPGATCPVLLSMLKYTWGDDEDYAAKVLAAQEFFGYLLMPHAKYKKCLILYGEPDSGKSQLLAIGRELVGPDNCSGIGVKDMGDPRKLAPIKGKFLNSLGEISQSAMIEDGGFKMLVSTGDAVQLDQKYEKAESYVPFAKHIFCGNSLPRVNDLTDATFNRMLILQFSKIIPKSEQDPHLLDKLIAEAPGILNWAIEGAKRLYENEGQFTVIPESVALLQKYKRANNAVNDFLHLYCRTSEGNHIDLDAFRTRYNTWRNERLSLTAIRRMVTSALGKKALDEWTLFDYAWKS